MAKQAKTGDGVATATRTKKDPRSKASAAPPTRAAATEARAATDDTLARTRTLPLPAAATIPRAPKGFVATDPATRRRALKRVGKDERAEVKDALQELIDKGQPALAEDFKGHAPDAALATALRDRAEAVDRAYSRALKLVAFLKEARELVWSDARTLVDGAHEELLHVARHEPDVKEEYPAVIKAATMRGEAIARGMARKRAQGEDEEPIDAGESEDDET